MPEQNMTAQAAPPATRHARKMMSVEPDGRWASWSRGGLIFSEKVCKLVPTSRAYALVRKNEGYNIRLIVVEEQCHKFGYSHITRQELILVMKLRTLIREALEGLGVEGEMNP